MPKRKKIDKSKILSTRVRTMIGNHRTRAKKHGVTLSYSLDELREIVTNAVSTGQCPYCTGPLTEKNFSADHARPIGRGGLHSLCNLVICCLNCNTAKGQLNRIEFRKLLLLLSEFPEEIKADVLSRLKAGAKSVKARKITCRDKPPSSVVIATCEKHHDQESCVADATKPQE